jgi:hypothetical protein
MIFFRRLMENSRFHCSAEWHFSRFHGKGTQYAYLIYSFALHLSKKSGIFSASAPTIAAYFDADVKSVRSSLRLLAATGFFEKVSSEPGASIRYKPTSHKDWAAKHPERCTEKDETPWAHEVGDPLGPELYAISGGRFMPYPNFVIAIRNTGHGTEAICEFFREHIEREKPVGKKWRNGFAGRFIKFLKSRPCSDPTQRTGRVGLPTNG